MVQGRLRRGSVLHAVAMPLFMLALLACAVVPVLAQDGDNAEPSVEVADAPPRIDLIEMARAGGLIGGVILVLSLSMVYLVMEHLLSIRRNAIVPQELAEAVHRHLSERKIEEAREACKHKPSFLAHVIGSGLSVIEFSYSDVEKAMEDAATEQAARLFRKIEYLHLIGTLAPMLGLLGTVWGMILAFMEFESKANPAVSELAPGIYRALVTTMMGLTVAVPAFAFFAIFRNRIDEFVAEASLTAEYVFTEFRRDEARRKKKAKDKDRYGKLDDPELRVPSIAVEREQRG